MNTDKEITAKEIEEAKVASFEYYIQLLKEHLEYLEKKNTSEEGKARTVESIKYLEMRLEQIVKENSVQTSKQT